MFGSAGRTWVAGRGAQVHPHAAVVHVHACVVSLNALQRQVARKPRSATKPKEIMSPPSEASSIDSDHLETLKYAGAAEGARKAGNHGSAPTAEPPHLHGQSSTTSVQSCVESPPTLLQSTSLTRRRSLSPDNEPLSDGTAKDYGSPTAKEAGDPMQTPASFTKRCVSIVSVNRHTHSRTHPCCPAHLLCPWKPILRIHLSRGGAGGWGQRRGSPIWGRLPLVRTHPVPFASNLAFPP